MLIVEGDDRLRDALRGFLAACAGIEVVATTGGAKAALRLCARMRPDVAVVGAGLGSATTGAEMALQLRRIRPEMRVVLLMTRENQVYLGHLPEGRAVGVRRELSRLTPRQRDILKLMARGYTNGAIAQRLRLSRKSVENQVNLLYRALDVGRSKAFQPRVEAVLLALGLQPGDE